jgi:hypothetical protein
VSSHSRPRASHMMHVPGKMIDRGYGDNCLVQESCTSSEILSYSGLQEMQDQYTCPAIRAGQRFKDVQNMAAVTTLKANLVTIINQSYMYTVSQSSQYSQSSQSLTSISPNQSLFVRYYSPYHVHPSQRRDARQSSHLHSGRQSKSDRHQHSQSRHCDPQS